VVPKALIDSGPLVAYYSAQDEYHNQIRDFFSEITYQLVTTEACIGEVMHLIRKACKSYAWKYQNEVLQDISDGIFEVEPLEVQDFKRIAELNEMYSDLPGDFADLSIVVISERINVDRIITLDSDFNVYRRYRDQAFNRIFYPHSKKLS